MKSEKNQPFGGESKFELLFELMEYHKIFVSPRLTPSKLADILGINRNQAEKLVLDRLGLSLKELLLLYREQYNKNLLLQGIDSTHVFQF